MSFINYEIKARASKEQQEKIKNFLKKNNAKFIGIDNQVDTYFKTKEGRLKIRNGNIENSLIFYQREDKKNSKQSNIEIYQLPKNSRLEKIIRGTQEILVVVNKKRGIYFIDNVKFHIDNVKELGRFVEIEAMSRSNIPLKKIKEQCEYYKSAFEIRDEDLIKGSYSDMLLEKLKNQGR